MPISRHSWQRICGISSSRLRRITQDSENWLPRAVEFANETTGLTSRSRTNAWATNSQILKANSGPVLAGKQSELKTIFTSLKTVLGNLTVLEIRSIQIGTS
jgi:hypothetical protein